MDGLPAGEGYWQQSKAFRMWQRGDVANLWWNELSSNGWVFERITKNMPEQNQFHRARQSYVGISVN